MRKLVLLCLLAMTFQVAAEPLEINGFTLDSPITFGETQKLGLDAYSATYPAGKPYKEIGLELVVVTYSAEAVKSMKEGGAKVGSVARSTFLGISSEPKEVNKTLFLGSTAARRVYHSKIPRQSEIHVFQSILKDGRFLMVAVRDFGGTGKVGDLLRGIANTLAPAK